jgi:hypothetical protein
MSLISSIKTITLPRLKKMTYEEFKIKADAEWEQRRIIKEKEHNKLFNKGLIKGLGFKGFWLYPLLKK